MWIILALIGALVVALYHLYTQNMRLDGNVFMIYRGITIVALLSPFLILNPMLFSGRLYMMAFLQAIVACYSDYLAYKVNRRCGAETVSSIIPFSVIITFFMWCMIEPSIIFKYIQTPIKTFVIILSLVGVAYALQKYYAVKLSRHAMINLLPILILSSMIAVLNKLIMNEGNEHQIIKATQLAWIVSFVISVVHLGLYLKKKQKISKLFVRKNIQNSFVFVLLMIGIILRTLAIDKAQNPAYVSCLVYTSLIWVMIFGKYIKFFRFRYKDIQVAKRWKLLFVFSVITLILCTK